MTRVGIQLPRNSPRELTGNPILHADFFAQIGSFADGSPLGIMVKQAANGDQSVELKQGGWRSRSCV